MSWPGKRKRVSKKKKGSSYRSYPETTDDGEINSLNVFHMACMGNALNAEAAVPFLPFCPQTERW